MFLFVYLQGLVNNAYLDLLSCKIQHVLLSTLFHICPKLGTYQAEIYFTVWAPQSVKNIVISVTGLE